MLFMALDKFPRDMQILKALLDMGYHANQWQLCEDEPELGMEPWPILFWALERRRRESRARILKYLSMPARMSTSNPSLA